MDTRIRFGKIHIIEWLRAGDRRTGWELSEEIAGIAETHRPPVSIGFNRVANRHDFIAYLRRMRDEFIDTAQLPLLHVETHGVTLDRTGGPHGIGTGADCVLWPELMQELIPLNELTGLRLFVTLAACEGVWGVQMLQPTERSAFLALFGPADTIDEDSLSRAMKAFYSSMFIDGTGDAAFRAANDAVSAAVPSFAMVTAEMAFRMVYGRFLRDRCTPAELDRRIESVLDALRWKFFIDNGRPMPLEVYEGICTQTRSRLQDHHPHFLDLRRNFFFFDIYPQNETRFPLTLNDCLREDY